MTGLPVPEALVWVHTEVETHDGQHGIVLHYECFSLRQTDFPVKIGHVTRMLTRLHLKPIPVIPVIPAQRDHVAAEESTRDGKLVS